MIALVFFFKLILIQLAVEVQNQAYGQMSATDYATNHIEYADQSQLQKTEDQERPEGRISTTQEQPERVRSHLANRKYISSITKKQKGETWLTSSSSPKRFHQYPPRALLKFKRQELRFGTFNHTPTYWVEEIFRG